MNNTEVKTMLDSIEIGEIWYYRDYTNGVVRGQVVSKTESTVSILWSPHYGQETFKWKEMKRLFNGRDGAMRQKDLSQDNIDILERDHDRYQERIANQEV